MWSNFDGPILDNLATHMKYLSTASSSYDHKFHLSKQLGMSPSGGSQPCSVATKLMILHKDKDSKDVTTITRPKNPSAKLNFLPVLGTGSEIPFNFIVIFYFYLCSNHFSVFLMSAKHNCFSH
jgi:hypothetical protein